MDRIDGDPFVGVAKVSGDWSARGDVFAAVLAAERGWPTWDWDFNSFSRCFLDSICERNAFSVVYTLLMVVGSHIQSYRKKDRYSLADVTGGAFR